MVGHATIHENNELPSILMSIHWRTWSIRHSFGIDFFLTKVFRVPLIDWSFLIICEDRPQTTTHLAAPQQHNPAPSNGWISPPAPERTQGHIEFSLCDIGDLDDPDGEVDQECFNKYPLNRAYNKEDASAIDPDFSGRYHVDPPCRADEVEQDVSDNFPEASYNIKIRYTLPDIECELCVVLQMRYCESLHFARTRAFSALDGSYFSFSFSFSFVREFDAGRLQVVRCIRSTLLYIYLHGSTLESHTTGSYVRLIACYPSPTFYRTSRHHSFLPAPTPFLSPAAGVNCRHTGYDEFDPPSWNSDCAPTTDDWIYPAYGVCGPSNAYVRRGRPAFS